MTSKKLFLPFAVVLPFIVIASLALFPTTMSPQAAGEDEKAAQPSENAARPGNIAQFMRKKLQASTVILEGLALDNMEMVQEGATELNRMSGAEKWRVFNDPMYRQFSAEFQRTAQDLADAAKDGNLDKAALKWMGATMNCIECHRYVRNNLIAGK